MSFTLAAILEMVAMASTCQTQDKITLMVYTTTGRSFVLLSQSARFHPKLSFIRWTLSANQISNRRYIEPEELPLTDFTSNDTIVNKRMVFGI